MSTMRHSIRTLNIRHSLATDSDLHQQSNAAIMSVLISIRARIVLITKWTHRTSTEGLTIRLDNIALMLHRHQRLSLE